MRAQGAVMGEVIVEAEGADARPAFHHDSSDLLSFLSFAAAERYGAVHPLAALANRLRKEKHIDTRPFWDFYDADPEDEQDREQLARLWQAPGPLAEAATASAAALRDDAALARLAGDFPALPDLLEDLAAFARRAAESGTRVRVTYRL
jgi:hypothetical protein